MLPRDSPLSLQFQDLNQLERTSGTGGIDRPMAHSKIQWLGTERRTLLSLGGFLTSFSIGLGIQTKFPMGNH